MYPPVFPNRGDDSSGERAAYEAFASLGDDVHVFYEPRLRLRGRAPVTPDFVVVLPERGVFVFESKRWHSVIASDGRMVTVERRDGARFVATHPLEQARSALFALKERLQTRPSLCNADGPHAGRLSFPLVAGVVWLSEHGKTTEVAEALKSIEPDEVLVRADLADPVTLRAALSRMPALFAGRLTPEMVAGIADELAPPVDELERFELLRGELVSLHRQLAARAAETGDTDITQRVDESSQHLVEGCFHVALFGSFSAGKTTLVNAMVPGLGLPTDARPTTAVPVVIARSDEPHIRVRFRQREQVERLNVSLPPEERLDPSFPEAGRTVELSSTATLADYVREGQTALHVDRVELGVPSLVLRAGVRLLDLPGTDSLRTLHRVIAEACIPLADVVVFVVNAGHALGESEADILEAMRQAGRMQGFDGFVFFLNQIDTVREPEEVEAHVRRQLVEQFGFERPRIVRGCARLGELARSDVLSEDEALEMRRMMRRMARSTEPSREAAFGASGVQALRDLLEAVVARRRGTLMLQAAVDRMALALDELQVRTAFRLQQTAASREQLLQQLNEFRRRIEVADASAVVKQLDRSSVEARRKVDILLESLGDLKAELFAIADNVGPQEASAPQAQQDMAGVERRWLRALQEACGRILGDLERDLAATVTTFEYAVRRDFEAVSQKDASYRPQVRMVNQREFTALNPGDWNAADKSLLAAVATGGMMGLVKGSVFPGVGNIAGALIGATIAGLGAFGGLRVAGRKALKERIASRVEDLRRDVGAILDSQVEGCRHRAKESVERIAAELEVLERQLAAAVHSGAQTEESIALWSRAQEAVDGLGTRLSDFCENAGLSRPARAAAMAISVIPRNEHERVPLQP
jgi:hypothetical protein